jgi:hypothetical protein
MSKVSFAEVASAIYNKAITIEEIEKICARLKQVEITSDIAEIISSDPIESSRVIPYYRNLKSRVFSVFENYQDDFEIIQDLNMYLISKIPDAKLTRVKWPEPGRKTDLKFSKSGNINEITKVIHEVIFLLRIKENIDYENSAYRGFSNVVNWLFKTANSLKGDATQKVVHVVLTPRDHEFLTKNLKVESDTLAYRAFLQTINLVIFLASLPSFDDLIKRIKDLLSNKVQGLSIKRNLSDTTNVEPYYIWMSVLSPEERGVLIKIVGENFFNVQNKLLRKFRSFNAGTSGKDLELLKKRVDNKLTQGVKATIYGRLKIYRDVQMLPDVKHILTQRKGTHQLTDAELRRYSKDRRALSLFAEENIIASAYDVINKPIEIMDLTRFALLNPTTDKVFYYIGDIESSITYKSLIERESKNNLTEGEHILLLSIRSRAIQFVPGITRRE